MKLQIGLSAINSYKRLSYTPWHAIAELVDNSTQSFFNNREVLSVLTPKNERPLRVDITYKRDNDLLSITDNAMGMAFNELERAMEVGIPPANTQGRSKYGMGLKTSASWLGDLWTIRTKKLGEPLGFSVTIDVNEVAAGNNELLWSEEEGDLKEHYTIIEIRKLNKQFFTSTLRKISDYLSSMYRQDFRDNILTLTWQGEILKWEELDAKLLRAQDGEIYKRNFEFFIQSEEDVNQKQRKKVSGWIGVLADGSRARAGFSIMHSGRVIRGWPDAWRPEMIYGQIQGTNDLINQRLVGEINLDDFDVSHTKDDILWIDEEEEQVQEQLRKISELYRQTARSYRKKAQNERGPGEAAVRTAVDRLKAELTSPELQDIITSNPVLTDEFVRQVVEAVKNSVIGKVPETFIATIDDIEVKLYINEMSVNDPYLLIETPQEKGVIILVNSSHPHWAELKGSDGVLNYLRHCTYDGIAEWQANKKRDINVRLLNADTVKLLKDKLLRVPFEIERNSAEMKEMTEEEN